jgi:hypothetical protein
MKIVVPFIFVDWAFLAKLPVLGPSVLVILSEMTHLLICFVNFLLKVGQPKHFFLFPLYLLVNCFEVSDLLVKLLLMKCWACSLSLLAPSFSQGERVLICVQWLQSSPWHCCLLRRHDEGGCLPKAVVQVHRRWAPMLVTYSQMLYIKNKATQSLRIKDLRLPKHYLHMGIILRLTSRL